MEQMLLTWMQFTRPPSCWAVNQTSSRRTLQRLSPSTTGKQSGLLERSLTLPGSNFTTRKQSSENGQFSHLVSTLYKQVILENIICFHQRYQYLYFRTSLSSFKLSIHVGGRCNAAVCVAGRGKCPEARSYILHLTVLDTAVCQGDVVIQQTSVLIIIDFRLYFSENLFQWRETSEFGTIKLTLTNPHQ